LSDLLRSVLGGAALPGLSRGEFRPPTVCLLALSIIADDPRVRRQGDIFHRNGWRVFGVGLPGGRSALPEWPILAKNQPSGGFAAHRDRHAPSKLPRSALQSVLTATSNFLRKKPGLRRLASTGWRLLGRCRLLLIRVRPGLAEKIFWSDRSFRDMHELADAVEADIWLANDWTALPIAARLAQEKGGLYVYDTHELATEEYAERLAWRLLQRPLVRALEGKLIRDAKVVSAVSAGIARRLDKLYSLPRPTLVIRNTPNHEPCPFRPTGERIRVLYHGIIAPGRGLEAAILSVADWRSEFDLSIRGPENPQFTPLLRARIAERRLEGRVALLQPVSMTTLVREAAAYDVGLSVLPAHSRNNEFALPNKFFEYIMAGLAVCVTDLPEMAPLVREYGLGVTLPSLDPAAIAAVINALDRETIDGYKRNALKAARELCWERESERMLSAYSAVLQRAAA
jgi:glycosyltransferase involved in cell wall biosynthesis